MGQYYKPIILNDNNRPEAWMYSWDFESGLKLMEHSWLKNDFVQTFEFQLSPKGKYHKSRVVWAGDYADNEPGTEHTTEDGRESGMNLYDFCTDENKMDPKIKKTGVYPFIVNHSKKVYVDKNEVPDVDGWVIHPLPLLTCEGNGRGGGDYRGNEDIVGSWARDIISVESEVPEGYEKIQFNLKEG